MLTVSFYELGYMREIGTKKICSQITNLHIKRPKDDFKLEDRFQKNGQFSVAYT